MKNKADVVFWWRENGPTVAFVGFTLIGIAYILVAKFGYFSPFLTTGVPVAVMLAYAGSTFFLRILKVQSEQAGDNLYYMGFLFTLTSLGVSLYLFQLEGSAQTIINNFGVAVGSTISGVFLRVIFAQARRDPIDIERNMRHELAEMTRRVRTEMDSASRELSSYRRSSGQMVTEGLEEIVKQAKINGELIQKTFEALSQEAIKPIQETATKLATLIERSNEMVDNHAERSAQAAEAAAKKIAEATSALSDTVNSLQTSVQGVVSNLDSLHMPADLIKVELAPVAQTVEQLVDTQKSFLSQIIDSQAQNMKALSEAIKPPPVYQTVGQLVDTGKALVSQIAESQAQNVSALGDAMKPLDNVGTALNNISQAMVALKSSSDAASQALSANAEKMDILSARIDSIGYAVSALKTGPAEEAQTSDFDVAQANPGADAVQKAVNEVLETQTVVPVFESPTSEAANKNFIESPAEAPPVDQIKPKIVEVDEEETRAPRRGWWRR